MEVRHCDYLPDIMKKAIRKHNELYNDNVTEVETDFYGTISIWMDYSMVRLEVVGMRLLLEGKNGNNDMTLENVKEYNECVHDRKICVSYNDDR